MSDSQNVYDAFLLTLPADIKHHLVMIVEEYSRAVKKFPTWPIDYVHASAVVAEESGELVRACLQHQYESGKFDELSREATQTGAMALRFLLNNKHRWCWACRRYVSGDEISDTGRHCEDHGGCGCKLL